MSVSSVIVTSSPPAPSTNVTSCASPIARQSRSASATESVTPARRAAIDGASGSGRVDSVRSVAASPRAAR